MIAPRSHAWHSFAIVGKSLARAPLVGAASRTQACDRRPFGSAGRIAARMILARFALERHGSSDKRAKRAKRHRMRRRGEAGADIQRPSSGGRARRRHRRRSTCRRTPAASLRGLAVFTIRLHPRARELSRGARGDAPGPRRSRRRRIDGALRPRTFRDLDHGELCFSSRELDACRRECGVAGGFWFASGKTAWIAALFLYFSWRPPSPARSRIS